MKNYYKILNVSPSANEEEINDAIAQSDLSPFLLEETRMVLLNKKLRNLYDSEFKLYQISESKNDYVISNSDLEKELDKIRVYVSDKLSESFESEEEPRSHSKLWIGLIVFFIIIAFKMCMDSHFAEKATEGGW